MLVNPDGRQHYDMGNRYIENSGSQLTIGQRTIHELVDVVQQDQLSFPQRSSIAVLDVACGPGNLTVEMKRNLEVSLPNTSINVTGLDYSADSLATLSRLSNGTIRTIVASFFDIPEDSGNFDYVFSNEGLHWQPPSPIASAEIISAFLSGPEREQHEAWALGNFERAIGNIFHHLSNEGTAVLQFGHEGQLQALWNVVRELTQDSAFQKYASQIHFPLFYPTLTHIQEVFNRAGFQHTSIDAFNQDLTETTPQAIRGFFQAFTEPGFARFFDPDALTQFYDQFEQKIQKMDVAAFRKDQWHRTLVVAKK